MTLFEIRIWNMSLTLFWFKKKKKKEKVEDYPQVNV